MSINKSLSIKLPKNYRTAEFLAHHQRDSLMVAERVDKNTLYKGLIWHGHAAQLTVEFKKDRALVQLDSDAKLKSELSKLEPSKLESSELENTARRILGLQQNIADFEKHYIDHPQLGQLIAKNSGLRVTVLTTPFEAISWAIIGQQISISAAISIRRKFIQLVDAQHSCGLLCYPDEHLVSKLSEDELRSTGFSQAKAKTLLALCNYFIERKLDLNSVQLKHVDIENISNELLQIRGIGPWSINYALLRGLGWLDGSLHGDVAVRRGLQKLLTREDKISERETKEWLEQFTPWRALVAAHLWEMK